MNDRMHALARARSRLQCIVFCLVLLTAFLAVPLTLHPLPTSARWPWLVDGLGVVVPSLPLNAARFAATFPYVTAAMVALLWALRRALRSVGRAQQELALQGPAGYTLTPWTTVAVCVSWLNWPVAIGLVVLLGVVALDFLPGTTAKSRTPIDVTTMARLGPASRVRCAGVHGDCRLAEFEAVQLAIRSDRINHTGIWLEAGATYSLQSVATSRWTDNDIATNAEGFRFDKNAVGVSRFWWAEWLRPLPGGDWFQVVRRVDSAGPDVPALGVHSSGGCWQSPDSGELVLLVNDIILGNNTGTMTLKLRRLAGGQHCSDKSADNQALPCTSRPRSRSEGT